MEDQATFQEENEDFKIVVPAIICTGIGVFVAVIFFCVDENEDNDTIIVHDGNRDQKTIEAFFTLKTYLEDRVEADYFFKKFLPDLGIQKITPETLINVLNNKERYIGEAFYFWGISQNKCVLAEEYLVQDIKEDRTGICIDVEVLPEVGEQRLGK